MKVILTKAVPNLGKMHAVCDVADGYAKNYLIKNNLAVQYTEESKHILSSNLDVLAKAEEEKVKKAKELKRKIDDTTLNFSLRGNGKNFFGSITLNTIILELEKRGIIVEKKMFLTKEDKLSIGTTTISLKIYNDIVATLNI
ncbi:MAG: 50S ribosomal protein L9, partial [Mycoplasmataceae bacterium]|nr:50S ribosomal protein L9 [Mycoplasmataceae bacterium]